jgi:hypothetical protein
MRYNASMTTTQKPKQDSPLSLRWDKAFIAEIDRARGDVPRSTFVRRAVERQIAETKPGQLSVGGTGKGKL